MKISSISQLSLLLAASFLWSCSSRSDWHRAEGAVWATAYHITYKGPADLHDSIRAVMASVEGSLSPFDPQSVISRINRGESDEVDSLVAKVWRQAAVVNRVSGGMFDPTVAPAVNLWRFGYKDSGREPSESEIDSVKSFVGFAGCDLQNGKIVRKSPSTEFDFSAITKGFGCDEVGRMLERNGCTDYMVEIGGEVSLRGKNDRGEPWHIMIEAPIESDSAVVSERMEVVELTDCGIATSGNYRNYRDTPDGRVGHTINPITCRPVKSLTLSATVIAPDAMTADALATACMAMPVDEALTMIDSLDSVAALIVVGDAQGGMKIMMSERFQKYVGR